MSWACLIQITVDECMKQGVPSKISLLASGREFGTICAILLPVNEILEEARRLEGDY